MSRKKTDSNELQVVNVRLVKEPSLYSTEKITSPQDAVKVIAKELSTWDREMFGVLLLKTNGQVIALNICSIGTLDMAPISPREIMKAVVLSSAAACIFIHNHPGADHAELKPSQEDRDVTRRLMEACDIIGVRFLDHVIVGAGNSGIYSFRSEGELDRLRPANRVWEKENNYNSVYEGENTMANSNRNNEITFEIVERIGALDKTNENGWTRELNVVAWNGGAPKLDIRDWSADHQKMSRGITMPEEQGMRIAQLLVQRAREKQRENADRDAGAR